MGEFYEPDILLKKADEILNESEKRNLTLRLLGALAFHHHCPKFNYIQTKAKRIFTDIDFMAYIEQKRDIEEMFRYLGYIDDKRIQTVPGIKRSIFFSSDQTLHSDVFYDVLEFSHEIDFSGRLKIDYPTISLVDLFLEKMQIFKINEKDIIDTIMLLREHEVGNSDDETINIDYLSKISKSDWGLWKTLTKNLDKIDQLIDNYELLNMEDKKIVRERIFAIREHIESEPATIRWKLRSLIGERVKWYNDVDEVM